MNKAIIHLAGELVESVRENQELLEKIKSLEKEIRHLLVVIEEWKKIAEETT